jgi:beta-galactosidase
MLGISIWGVGAAYAAPVQPRIAVSLDTGWRFKQGPQSATPAELTSPGFDDSSWEPVVVPHTWNRVGNEGLERSPLSNTFRGVSWYRLRFAAPAQARGRRAFLQFDAVSIVADVWLNGHYLGKHEGAFSRFRFDVTDAIDPAGPNLLVVRADNSRPEPGSSTDHVIPLSGDFFMFGGIYRDVSLIVTDPIHVDLMDFGGPGVYGQTVEPSAAAAVGSGTATATVRVTERITNDLRAARPIVVQTRIEDMAGTPVASDERRLRAAAGKTAVVDSTLHIDHPRLWRGVADPYLYRIVVTLRGPQGVVLDEVRQPLGLRTMRFDPDHGFFLNGERYRLVGASMHQDRPRKGWAISRSDQEQDFALLRELGGTAVRLAHYQHDQYSYDLADARGIVAWAEIPLVNQVAFDSGPASEALAANARQQLTELIRQNFNHPAIAVWSIANEINLRVNPGGGSSKPRSLLEELNTLAKKEDASRPTTLADCCEPTDVPEGQGPPAREEPRELAVGITDVIGYNRYFGWYRGTPEQFGPVIDEAHTRHPRLPIAISEYGAGAALTQHTDNPVGGRLNAHGRPHPEEVQTWYHEESWPQLRSRDYLWGVFIWNLFDFAVDTRQEGDLSDMNDKGLISYDRGVKKDAFYYYQANWSDTPVLHLTGRRYLDHPYGVTDVKAYSNAREAKLSVNGVEVGVAACSQGICRWPGVRLTPGLNTLVATARSAMGVPLKDQLEWTYAGVPSIVRIKAGDLAGAMSASGERYGPDAFFSGGEAREVRLDTEFYNTYRQGTFSYDIPVPNGTYQVTLKLLEPSENGTGKRLFDVRENGRAALSDVDVFALAGGKLKAVDRSFVARVTDGHLRIGFQPKTGPAVVSAIGIAPTAEGVE